MKKRILLAISLLLSFQIFAQKEQLLSGPMLGYNTMKEVSIWCQTIAPAECQIIYWPVNDWQLMRSTKIIETTRENAHTCEFILDYLEPGTSYQYALLINGQNVVDKSKSSTFRTQAQWKWRSDPEEFSFLTGSCTYINEAAYDRPGTPYGTAIKILDQMSNDSARFMLWLGDNMYMRESDWESRSGVLRRYTHTRQTKEMQPLLSKMHHYAIWDDHDFGSNDANGSYVNKSYTREAFDLFWANPRNANEYNEDGIYTKFTWQDCEFFLLDGRYNKRRFGKEGGELLGEKQLNWLLESLAKSDATFKFIAVGSQFLNDATNKECFYVEGNHERQTIIDFIEKYKIKGVVFITGDRHFTEFASYKNKDKMGFYEITSSPITSTVATGKYTTEPNSFLEPGSRVLENVYTKISVSGPQKNRMLKLEVININGDIKWKKTLSQIDFEP